MVISPEVLCSCNHLFPPIVHAILLEACHQIFMPPAPSKLYLCPSTEKQVELRKKDWLVMSGFGKGAWGTLKSSPVFPEMARARYQPHSVVAVEGRWALGQSALGWNPICHLGPGDLRQLCFPIYKGKIILICGCCLFFWPHGHLPSSLPLLL